MSQISLNPVSSTPALPSVAPATQAPGDRTLTRAVVAGIKALNDAGYAGDGREVTFSVDPATKISVIKVIDSATKEVIQQLPPEYLLQIAAEIDHQKEHPE